MPLLLTDKTAERVRELVGRTAGVAANPPVRGGRHARPPVFARCTVATAAAGSGVGAECYPCVIVDPLAPHTTPQPELGTAWLTLLDGSGVGVPAAGAVYECLLTGELTIGGDTRPRAFGVGGTPPPPDSPPPAVTVPLYCTISGSEGGDPAWDCVLVVRRCDGYGRFRSDAGYVMPCSLAGADPCTPVSGEKYLAGAAFTSFLSSLPAGASVQYAYCCTVGPLAGCFTAAIPGKRCVTLSNGTGSFAGLTGVTTTATNTGGGWAVAYTGGGVTVAGSFGPCPGKCGLFFSGTISSTNPDPAHHPLYDCGCSTRIDPCAADGSEVSQTVTAQNPATGSQTLHVVTGCGSFDIAFGPCPSFNCVSGSCVDPGDGSGMYPTMAACLAAPCSPPPPPPPPACCASMTVAGHSATLTRLGGAGGSCFTSATGTWSTSTPPGASYSGRIDLGLLSPAGLWASIVCVGGALQLWVWTSSGAVGTEPPVSAYPAVSVDCFAQHANFGAAFCTGGSLELSW